MLEDLVNIVMTCRDILAPRFCMAAVYKKTGEKMEYPDWFEKTKINTVHVRDVAR